MNNPSAVIKILQSIQGNGTFVTTDTEKFVHPGLHLTGVGTIGLPWTPEQLNQTIAYAEASPYGKGSETITDPAVRNSWQIDADQISFDNPDWNTFIQRLLRKVKDGLGVESADIEANLYKLLIYEEGGFFLPHKDSEKEPGMFGTMIIGLPCAHTGGELIVRFDGREKRIDFSKAADNYKIPYVAFYADCEHEIQQVTSGHRICLVYNLIQPKTSDKIQSPRFQKQVAELTEVLSTNETTEIEPTVILLGHQYTPANFSLSALKHHDLPRAEAIAEAAEKAGYFVKLGLLTHYQMGNLEYDYGYGYEPISTGSMGEVFDEMLTVEHWLDNGIPDLGQLEVLEKDIIKDIEFNADKPIEEEEEHFTGNAGMTIEYWYHYAAMIIWSKKAHPVLLKNTSQDVRLRWLAFYLDNWHNTPLAPQQNAKRIVLDFAATDFERSEYRPFNFSAVATALVKLEDEALIKKCQLLLVRVFNDIKTESWIALMKQYNDALFASIFQQLTGDGNNIRTLNHLLEILVASQNAEIPKLEGFALGMLKQLPNILQNTNLHKKKERDYYYWDEDKPTDEQILKSIIEKLLQLSRHLEGDQDWHHQLIQSLTTPLPRRYVNKILVPVLLSQTYKGIILNTALLKICQDDLRRRTAEKPLPPADWSRKVPQSKSNNDLWEMLRPFLESKDQKVFDYRKNQSLRDELTRVIDAVSIDLKKETIRIGSPHTLRLIKTQASYENKLRKWKEDITLLEKLSL